MRMARKVRRVGVVAKPNRRRARPLLRELVAELERRGLEVRFDEDAARILGRSREGIERPEVAGLVDLVVVVGGDGTLLSVARSVGRQGPPVVGVNLGSLGFLADFSREELAGALDDILAGRHRVQRRMMLSASLLGADGRTRRFRVLNDVVINKSALARIVDIELSVDGQPVVNYRADGLIFSTPTGSTAYCLSAGGPIVHPELQAIVVIPICPHTLTNRPLVVPAGMVLEARVQQSDGDVVMTLDGQVGLPLGPEDRVRIRRSVRSLPMITFAGRNHFQVLRRKLKWGSR